MNLNIKKIIIAFFVLIIVFNSSSGFLKLEKARAIPVEEVGPSLWDQILEHAETIAIWIKENIWEMENRWARTMRDIIAKRILDHIVNQTVKWIQGGGKPKFIGNWEGFIRDVGDIAFDSVIKEVGLAGLCSPFGLQIKIGLLPVERFGDRIDCTLDKVVSNIENFYVDFSVGGWRGYNLLFEPNNNYYGAVINIADEIVRRTAEKTKAAENEGLAGGGFIGDKICKAGSSKENKEGNDVADRDGKYCDPKNLVDATPGSLVGKAVGEAITSDSRWAANIQSWTSALVNAVINRVIKEGVLAMQDATSKKPDSYYPPEYKNILGQELEKDKQQMYGEINRFTNEWQYLLDVKNQALSSASSTLAVSRQLQQLQSTQTPLPLACEPAVTAQDIQNAQNEINRLTTEIQGLRVKINAANGVRTQIANANFLDEFQRSAAQIAYRDFINQYGTTAQLESIISGSARQAADVEKQNKQTELDNIQTRLNAC